MEGGGRRSPPPKDKGGGLCDVMGGDGKFDGGLLEGARTPEKSPGRGALVSLTEGVEDGVMVEKTCVGGFLEISMEKPNNFGGQVNAERILVDGNGEGMLWEMAAVQELKDGRVETGGGAKPCGMVIDQELKGGENCGGGVAAEISVSSNEQGLYVCGGGRRIAGEGDGGRKLLTGTVMEGVTTGLISGSPYGKGIDLLPEFNPSSYSNLERNYDLSNLPIQFNVGPRILINGDKGKPSSNYSTELASVTPNISNIGGNLGAARVGHVAGSVGEANREEFNMVDYVMAAADMAGAVGESYTAGVHEIGGA